MIFTVPGDKSITQRALILSVLAEGRSRLRGLLTGLDWARASHTNLLANRAAVDRLGLALLAPALSALPDGTFPARKDSRYGVSLAQPMYLDTWEVALGMLADAEFAPDLAAWLRHLYGTAPSEVQVFESFLHDAANAGLQLDVIDLSQQEDFPDYMERLAAAGAGQVRHGDTAGQIQWGLVESLLGASPVVATDAVLEVAFNPRAVAGYRLLGYEPSPGGPASPGANSGELRSLQAGTALYEVWLLPNETDDVATARVSWIEHGPMMTMSRSSMPCRMRCMAWRAP